MEALSWRGCFDPKGLDLSKVIAHELLPFWPELRFHVSKDGFLAYPLAFELVPKGINVLLCRCVGKGEPVPSEFILVGSIGLIIRVLGTIPLLLHMDVQVHRDVPGTEGLGHVWKDCFKCLFEGSTIVRENQSWRGDIELF